MGVRKSGFDLDSFHLARSGQETRTPGWVGVLEEVGGV